MAVPALGIAQLTPPFSRRTLRRMAKKSGAEPTAKTPRRDRKAKTGFTGLTGLEKAGINNPENPVNPVSTLRPSALPDTRVVYCGDNLERPGRLPGAGVDLIYIDPPFKSDASDNAFFQGKT
jgi:hypothetical protein